MRLVDADSVKEIICKYENRLRQHDMIYAVECLPTEEIIHCNRCKFWQRDNCVNVNDVGVCELAGYLIGKNGYCLYGKEKDESGK